MTQTTGSGETSTNGGHIAHPRVAPAGKPDTIRTAVQILREGGVVAVPTDTVFGLVGLFDSEQAVTKIFEMKGRSYKKPLPLLVGTAGDLPLVTDNIPKSVWPLIYAHWPGPLTIIFHAKDSVSRLITGTLKTVGVRVPAHTAVLDLLEAVSLPLASTSANRSGEPPAASVEDVLAHSLPVDLIVDPGGQPLGGLPSTVVDITTNPVLIRRKGSVTAAQVRDALGLRVDVA